MAWFAKQIGAYPLESAEGTENALEFAAFFRPPPGQPEDATDEAIAGMLGNVMAESGLNPWRWEGDTSINRERGYGLFQFTPATQYYAVMNGEPYFSPNWEIGSSPYPGATPDDAICQLTALAEDKLGKWARYCWRNYWNVGDYNDLWKLRYDVVNTWGSNDGLSWEQFLRIDDLRSATYAFLACYEGPSVPNLDPRVANAEKAYELIKTGRRGMPIWMMLRKF